MTYFAQVDINNKVQRVLVITQDFINSGIFGDPSYFIETSIDTSKGVNRKGNAPLRKNYAGIGYSYDADRDAFIPPKPNKPVILNETLYMWDLVIPDIIK